MPVPKLGTTTKDNGPSSKSKSTCGDLCDRRLMLAHGHKSSPGCKSANPGVYLHLVVGV